MQHGGFEAPSVHNDLVEDNSFPALLWAFIGFQMASSRIDIIVEELVYWATQSMRDFVFCLEFY